MLLGDHDDGSRASPVHRIPLFDEDKQQVNPQVDEEPLPFSTRTTCGDCHSYDIISGGWHFDSAQSNVPAGRRGEPWVMVDRQTRTQIPISNRAWPGVFPPQQAGLTPWLFLRKFGTHVPGGNYGEITDQDDPKYVLRWMISGALPINCLVCHDAAADQDKSEFALQVFQQNYRWAATGSCPFAAVAGDASTLPDTYDPLMGGFSDNPAIKPPVVTYDKTVFDAKGMVFFDIVRQPPARNCYFCHSTQDLEKAGPYKEWTRDEDVHLLAGLTCVDCHRNGLDHMITRGTVDPKQPDLQAKTLTCEGCHLGDPAADSPIAAMGGRLGAPKAAHQGLPPIHFDKLSCTACHSGNWPGKKATLVRTSRIHHLGLHGKHNPEEPLPHIAAPVFALAEDGKITPQKLIWPAYWAYAQGGKVTIIPPEAVKEIAGKILEGNLNEARVDDWNSITREQISQTLTLLAAAGGSGTVSAADGDKAGEPVYVSGGKIYALDEKGALVEKDDDAAEAIAQPYSWPLAHDVRPAAQSLGATGCEDCHSTESAFFYGEVAVDTPVKTEQAALLPMYKLQQIPEPQLNITVNRFFKWLIIITMVVLILHIIGDLFSRLLRRSQ